MRAAVDLLMFVMLAASGNEDEATHNVAQITGEMNAHARASYAELLALRAGRLN